MAEFKAPWLKKPKDKKREIVTCLDDLIKTEKSLYTKYGQLLKQMGDDTDYFKAIQLLKGMTEAKKEQIDILLRIRMAVREQQEREGGGAPPVPTVASLGMRRPPRHRGRPPRYGRNRRRRPV